MNPTYEVLEVWAPGEDTRPGGLSPEGGLGRCACCGKRIAWRAVVRVDGAVRVYGLTCAGINASAGKRRARAERLVSIDPDWATWARNATRPEAIRRRPLAVLEAWSIGHGAGAREIDWRALDGVDPIPRLLEGTAIPALKRALAALRGLDEDFPTVEDRVKAAGALASATRRAFDGLDRGWVRRLVTHGAPRTSEIATTITELADRLAPPPA